MKHFPHYLQYDAMDCGPTCLRMIAKYYGKNYSLQTLRERSFITREGVSMLGISDAAESIGFRTMGVRISLKQLHEDMPLPCILHWKQNHFVVLHDIRKTRNGYCYHIADPASQLVTYTETEMRKCWLVTKHDGEEKGAALALEPSPQFYEEKDETDKQETKGLLFFAKYLFPYRKEFIQLLLGMLVGASGSGKTTLLKLLLGFYEPNKGDIRMGDTPIGMINPHLWRAKSGAVMQEGFIFSDTIANNIAVNTDHIDIERLRHAVTVANIRSFIDSLPLGYNTKIGMEGNGVSQGQRQRLLNARAVYKNPEFLFFDEATNALDANNEKEIMEHLNEFYRGKTVVVVAHRLSTVKNADKIVVLDKGKVAEEGTHKELTERKGLYYQLVKNQLELGN